MKKSNKNSKAILFAFQQEGSKAITVEYLETIKSRYSGESQIFDVKKLSYSNGLSNKPEAHILILRNFYNHGFLDMEYLEWEKKTESVISVVSLIPGQSIIAEQDIKSLTDSTEEFTTFGKLYRVAKKNEIKNNQSNYLLHISEKNTENYLIFNWYMYGVMTAQEITVPIFSGDLCIMCDNVKKYNNTIYELRYYFHNY